MLCKMTHKTFLKEEVWKCFVYVSFPLSLKKKSQVDKHPLVSVSLMFFHFNSIEIEAVLMCFHGLSELMRGTKARIKTWGHSSVLDEKACPMGPCASL